MKSVLNKLSFLLFLIQIPVVSAQAMMGKWYGIDPVGEKERRIMSGYVGVSLLERHTFWHRVKESS
ncbi:hypothetical protein [Lutimonas sp.]|uniref:hypothetical protein n=1 Tax=Lutimonas sp. TaxID=1872403 RepID=UPI003D9B57DE